MGCLDVGGIPQDCQEYIDYLQKFLLITQQLFFSLPLHKIYPTQAWKQLIKTQGAMFKISMNHIQEAIKERNLEIRPGDTEPSVGESFISYMMNKGQMSLEEVTMNAADLLGAGVDTVSLQFHMFHNVATLC